MLLKVLKVSDAVLNEKLNKMTQSLIKGHCICTATCSVLQLKIMIVPGTHHLESHIAIKTVQANVLRKLMNLEENKFVRLIQSLQADTFKDSDLQMLSAN